MNTSEAITVLLNKINNLEPVNASKIFGYIVINLQDSDLVRIASSPDYVLHTLVLSVKQQLELSQTPPPPPPSPLNTNPRHSTTPNSSLHAWSLSSFSNKLKSFPIPSHNGIHIGSGSKSSLSTSSKTECNEQPMVVDLSFLNESPENDENLEDLIDAGLELGQKDHGGHSIVNNGDASFHRRSYSTSNMYLGSEEKGYKRCRYFDRGYCKNGSNCKFVHDALTDSVDALVGSHKKLVATSSAASLSSYEKHINFLIQRYKDAQRGAAVMMGDEFHMFSQCSPERNDFVAMKSAEKAYSSSRQIYLTFPAESTFKDEDVSEYFSKFGPVQDVRIPYQQKRMFGFVTFVSPKTVKHILSLGIPHFICDSRVRVKPYKEKGKVPDKRQQQQLERGEFSPCLTPSGPDSTEPYDFHLGVSRLYNPHEILLRTKLEEQAELQHAIELQERRLMNLELPDFKNNHIGHHQRSLSVGASLPSPQIHSNISNPGLSSDSNKGDITGSSDNLISTISLAASSAQPQQEVDPASIHDIDNGNRKDCAVAEITDMCNSVEKALLPGGLFSSPTNAAGYNLCDFSTLAEVNESGVFSTSLVSSNKLEPQHASSDMASH